MIQYGGKKIIDIAFINSETGFRDKIGLGKINNDVIYNKSILIEGATSINVGDTSSYYLVINNTRYPVTDIECNVADSIEIINNEVVFKTDGDFTLLLKYKSYLEVAHVTVSHVNFTLS